VGVGGRYCSLGRDENTRALNDAPAAADAAATMVRKVLDIAACSKRAREGVRDLNIQDEDDLCNFFSRDATCLGSQSECSQWI
jgi:hypothetical protein